MRPTGAIRDVDDQERVWIDELKLSDDAFDGHSSTAIVDARNRMMRVGCPTADDNCRSEGKRPPVHGQQFYPLCAQRRLSPHTVFGVAVSVMDVARAK